MRWPPYFRMYEARIGLAISSEHCLGDYRTTRGRSHVLNT